MSRTFSTGVEVPTAGDRHPSEAWWTRVGATTNAAILNETGKARTAATAAVDALRKTVTQDYVDRATAAQYGIPGPATKISIGTVTGGPTAAANMTGTAPAQSLNLTLPQGPRGPEGPGGAFQMAETADPGLFQVSDVPNAVITSAAQGVVDAATAGAMLSRGFLPAGADLDMYRQPEHAGMWQLLPSRSYVNSPIPNTGLGILIVFPQGSVASQRVVRHGTPETWERVSRTSASWNPWSGGSPDVGAPSAPGSGAFTGAPGRKYVVVAGVMRNPGTGWAALDDTIHRHTNVEETLTDAQTITVRYPSVNAIKVVSWVCTPDEQLTKAGYACAASVSLTEAKITVSRHVPMADYVQYNATNGWSSLNGVFRNLTFLDGTLTMEHDSVGGDNFMDFQVTGRGGCLVSSSAQAGGSTQTVTKIDFRDYSGALIKTPTPDMKAYVSRGSMGAVDPTTLTTTRYPASNIWYQGIFELG